MKTYEIVGWDAGYGYNKLVAGSKNSDMILFPSITYKPTTGTSIFNVTDSNAFSIDKMIIQYENDEFFVGSYAIEQDPYGGIRSYNENKFSENAEIVKLLAGITLLNPNESEIHIETLALGLSLGNYKKHKKDIVKNYENKIFKFKVPSFNSKVQEITLSISKVICIPQGVSSFYDILLNFRGIVVDDSLENARYGLIDVGGKTVDAFISQGIEPVRGSELALSYGTSDIFRDIANNLDNDIPFNLIEQAYISRKEEFFWKGDYYNTDEICNPGFISLAENIHAKIQMHWTRHLDRVELLLLCGGGSKLIAKHLSKLFNIRTEVIDEPQFSNARGYYKLGLYSSARS